ncbi:polysaccharide pyruvyl transferase family protein [Roseomonas terrae]|uniref:Polysaccharide pyruvyl transferase family protein n=1 Tax=Neoroseomonas terrae TaxID=424799 RepID=A0ABS5EPZ3_9PROT|nr:polysaccharide pyruvyl transferase family protein [Neoroseomonas terrae]MBR0653100.1 polysaccharide pyruvyl transferase family protein [Neoroseomonas terrae]
MVDRLHQAVPGVVAYPYCAASALGDGQAEAVVVHKGMLRALGWRRLAATIAAGAPVLANDVFVVFRRGATQPPAGIEAHLAPLLAFCRHWQSLPRRAARGSRAVVSSAWNLGNCGDDAVTLAAAAICRRLGFDEVSLLGPDGPLDLIEDAGFVLLGGGGLIYDNDIANTANYTAPLRFAADCGVPHAALGVGTQGIRTAFGRAAYLEALSGAAVIAARDRTDVTELREGCGLAQVELGADLAFALPELEPHWFAPVVRPTRPRPLALLSLGYTRETPGLQGETLLRTILGLARSVGETHELLLARHSTDDAAVHAEAARILGIRHIDLAALGVPMAIATYAAADLVVTSRFHGTIFAALTGTPVATVCNASAKLGRLVNQALPSLAGAMTPLDESGSPALDGRDLARLARPAAPAEVAAQRRAALAAEGRLAAALGRRRTLAPEEPVRASAHMAAVPAFAIPPAPAAPPLPWGAALVDACAQLLSGGGIMLTIGAPPPPALHPAVQRRLGRHGTALAERTALTLTSPGDAARRVKLDPDGPWLDSIAAALAADAEPVAVLRLAGTEIALAHRAVRLFDPAVMVLERPGIPPDSDSFDALLVTIGLTRRLLLAAREGRLTPVPLFEAEPALRQRAILCTEAASVALQPQPAAAP